MLPYLTSSIIILVILIVLLVVWLYRTKGLKEARVDYRTLFILGLVWLPLGISTDNKVFFVISLAFIGMGLANRDKWKKNDLNWKDLTPKQKNLKLGLVIGLLLLLLLGVTFFFLAERGMLY